MKNTLLLGLFFFLSLGVVSGQFDNDDQGLIEPLTANESGSVEIEIDGLVIDKTKTKAGRDFYQAFFKKWVAPPEAKDFTILINENPGRGRGTQVLIFVNDLVVVNRFLQPQADYIEQTALQSIAQVQIFLANYENIKQQLNNDDQQGSGIY